MKVKISLSRMNIEFITLGSTFWFKWTYLTTIMIASYPLVRIMTIPTSVNMKRLKIKCNPCYALIDTRGCIKKNHIITSNMKNRNLLIW